MDKLTITGIITILALWVAAFVSNDFTVELFYIAFGMTAIATLFVGINQFYIKRDDEE